MSNEMANRAKEIIELQAERTSLKTMADYVKEYIVGYCDEDPAFVERVNDPLKNFMDCIGYIKKKALEWLKEQQNLELTSYTQGVGGDVPNDICYQWAVEYYYSKPEPKPAPKEKAATGAKTKKNSKAAKTDSAEGSVNTQMSLLDMMDTEKKGDPVPLFDEDKAKDKSEEMNLHSNSNPSDFQVEFDDETDEYEEAV